ncbi:MarR family transcriptional regulator [Phototrophicus methaneseepsis]|uniref:MarR family transcriptional regulator n=1 Tax=Phototrophicus methaneseepsis TaxID=2710758 RepID=A0A7S8E9F1_9CHLR|nr:MarR family transcriptional regulator [Phototrophicus methaneseepsis]QPC82669.1 MarR family transcriptional regulator [Phototrophicus methaneseepsis]
MDRPKVNDAQLLAQFCQMYRSAVDTFMVQAGMYRGQGLLLCEIAHRDGMTQSEIADALSVQGATITNMLKRMEEANLVVRRRDEEDNRLVRVYVTDEGREIEIAIGKQLASLEDTLFAGISQADRDTFRRIIWQMVDNMDTNC